MQKITANLCLAVAMTTVGLLAVNSSASAQVTGGTDGAEIPDTLTLPAASAAMHAQFDYAGATGELTLLSAAAAVGTDTAAMASPTFAASVGTSSVVDGLIETGALTDSLNAGAPVTDGATISFTAP